jgi:glycosyltransferase involved in cell wall biosynthesis
MNKVGFPFISIIVPCRNEEKYISKCLDSLIAQDYPKDRLEILVVDGMSKDKTREITYRYASKYPFIGFLENRKKVVPPALNIGIKCSEGDLIMIVGSHTIFRQSYISKCVKYMQEYKTDNVGGVEIVLPGSDGLMGKAIAFALSHLFGIGNARYRIGSKKPMWVDTVAYSCYKRQVFEKIGLFDENLVRNQDIEFNLRLRKAEGKILLVPEIISYYHARPTLRAFAKQNFGNGFWVIYSTKFAKMPFSIRHLVPFFFVLSLVGSLILSLFFHPFIYLLALVFGAYLILNILFSVKLSLKKGFKYFPSLILSFSTLHFSYGFGSIWGVIKLIIPKKR